MNWSLLTLPLVPILFLAGIAVVIVVADDVPRRFFESEGVKILVKVQLWIVGIGAVALTCAAATNWAIS